MPDGRSEPAYALPRSTEEYERLSRQAAFLRGTTDRLFQAAGVGPGMRILDVGSGAGDVAFLAAELVGPTGHVVGVDLDRAAVETARRRAEALGLGQVTFRQGDVRSLALDESFDGVVGRLVLMYLGSPVEVLRQVAAHVRPGGVVVFQELDLNQSTAAWSLPEGTLWSETGRLLIETFLRAGMQPRMGRRLFAEFNAAGLSIPEMRDEALVGGGPDFEGYLWLAGLARSLAPVMKKLAITDTDRLDLGTLTDRLRQDAIAKGAVVWMPSLVGAYAHRP